MKLRGLRWWVVGLLFGAAVLNYMDRQTLSALAPTLQKDLGLDDGAYAKVINIFLVGYTIAYLVSGRIADKIGTRLSMGAFVTWWSVANMLTAAAQGLPSLAGVRFLLGLGEAGVWPAASKAVSEWFPASERAFAIGLYTMGATIGATLTPYLVIPLATQVGDQHLPALAAWLGSGVGWRLAFFVTGAAGLVWLVFWLFLYQPPNESKCITARELRLLAQSATAECPAGTVATPAWSWKQVLWFRGTWLLLLGRLITDPVWYFYQFWFPKYLAADRHLSQEQLSVTWVVYAAAGIGSLLGGWLSGQFVKRGAAPASSRLWVMCGCACLMPLSPVITAVAGTQTAMALTALMVLAALAWLINLSSLVVDVVPKHSLGTVFSVVAAGSTLGGILMNLVVATIVSGSSTRPAGLLGQGIQTLLHLQGRGYAQWFLLMAFLHPAAWLVLKLGGMERFQLVLPSQTLRHELLERRNG